MTLDEAKRSVHALYGALMRPGSGQPYAVSDGRSVNGGQTVFHLGVRCDDGLTAAPQVAVYRLDAQRHSLALHPGPAKLLEVSPDGGRVAFALPGPGAGQDRIAVMASDGSLQAEHVLPGAIEQLAWSPDGNALLMRVAGPGTDTTTLAGSLGVAATAADGDAPGIDRGEADPGDWRRLWFLNTASGRLDAGPSHDGMLWEASWCGAGQVAVLHSARPGEAAWYRAELGLIDLASGRYRTLHHPRDQIGHVAGSPDGASVAFVEGLASDRGLVCGTLKLVRCSGSLAMPLRTGNVEISSVAWRGNDVLHVAGLQGLETVVGEFDLRSAAFDESWRSLEFTCGAHVVESRPAGAGTAVITLEGFDEAPVLALLRGGAPEILAPTGSATRSDTAHCTAVRWAALDGVEVEGLLIRPLAAGGPTPLVVDIHGGPIWAHRNRWQGRQRATPALIAAGISVLCPNPRGSFGRGQAYTHRVLGDMGGADACDILKGIDHLVAAGLADATRVGLTGSSYGGFMSAWLPQLRDGISAAAVISPVSNWFSQHGTSNMPILEELFIGGPPTTHGELYLARSPALSGRRSSAATLTLAGALDRCTPLGQAVELHRSLLERGAISELVTYPTEGHGVRSHRTYLDSAARITQWFVQRFSQVPARAGT